MCRHEIIQNELVGLDERPPVSTWRMCEASDSPRSVKLTMIKQYKKMWLVKNGYEELIGIGEWPPISIWVINTHNLYQCDEYISDL